MNQRAIKFRAWDGHKIWWVETWDELQDKSLQIMQFTGLKDKNGKEVYEGDIVTENRELIYQVIWCDDKFRLGFRLKSINGDGLLYSFEEVFGYGERGEIIGNIYDNPDLLKESNN